MIKKLCTLLLLTCTAAPILAQQYSSNDGASFAPKKGQWQVSVLLGNGKFFDENTSYLLPKITNTSGEVGLPNGGTDHSGDLNSYLNIGGLNTNSLVNVAGIEGKYFVSDSWDINFQFSMNISLTPKKDYVDGNGEVPDMIIPAQSYINAQMTNNWYTSIGSNYYFKTRNERIHPYIGAALGFQMARIETTEPYTGKTFKDSGESGKSEESAPSESTELPEQVYTAGSKAGQMYGFRAAAVAGIEYSIAKGFVFGFEMQPLAYRYDVIQICPKGFDTYNVSHHNIKIFEMPMVKLGFRF